MRLPDTRASAYETGCGAARNIEAELDALRLVKMSRNELSIFYRWEGGLSHEYAGVDH